MSGSLASAVIGIDTNILLYAHREKAPQHLRARRALEHASEDRDGWGFALASLAEFWSVATHPLALGGPAPADRIVGFFREISKAGGQTWFPGEGFEQRLLRLASQLAIQGARVFDLQIALTAFDNGATEIWTHDRDFSAFPGLRVHDPL